MDEHAFIRSVHRRLSPAVHAWKINARFANGVADCWYSGPAGDLWVEYKWRPQCPTRSWTPGLSSLQKKWLTARHREGRAIAVVVGMPLSERKPGAIILTDEEWEGSTDRTTPISIAEVIEWIERATLCTSTPNRTAHARRSSPSSHGSKG